MVEKEFENLNKFYEFVNENLDVRNGSAAVESFCDSVEKINVGCGCQKKARVGRANRYYLALTHEMTLDTKDKIKQKLEAEKVKFLHDGNLFLEI